MSEELRRHLAFSGVNWLCLFVLIVFLYWLRKGRKSERALRNSILVMAAMLVTVVAVMSVRGFF